MSEASTVCRVSLVGEVCIYVASELKAQLLAPLHDGSQGAIEVDLSQVSEMDTVGVQLLMLLEREAGAVGRAVHLVGHSPAVLDAWSLLDLDGHFGDVRTQAAA